MKQAQKPYTKTVEAAVQRLQNLPGVFISSKQFERELRHCFMVGWRRATAKKKPAPSRREDAV